jgi:hypothetical protein
MSEHEAVKFLMMKKYETKLACACSIEEHVTRVVFERS